uniref:NADH dehydrogenase subunit 6 n=1 Tax=Ruditapes decussatus TaxID=104385 RepID=A0A219LVW6_9BIVA|nr:NADH dehydrogenase subunit 6 [Ruditapes decussatus]AJY78599.1 NADH dehydrogenase subunit 6 [Ruditapes decussatus]
MCCMGLMNVMSRYNHPMYFGFALLFLVAGLSGVLSFYGGVYGFMVFMCIVSGILVVFAYSVALAPLVLEEAEFYGLASEQKTFLGGASMSFSSLGAFLVSVVFIYCLVLLGTFIVSSISVTSFQSVLYVSKAWGVAMSLFSLFLFLIMVFSVSVASKYSGALIK